MSQYQIRQRAEAATKGPWAHHQHGTGIRGGGGGTYNFVALGEGGGIIAERSPSGTPADIEFIAHARTDIPRLLAALDAVLALHKREPLTFAQGANCNECEDSWPCPTVAAVNNALEAGK